MGKSNLRLEILVRVLADLALLNISLLFGTLPQILFRHLHLPLDSTCGCLRRF